MRRALMLRLMGNLEAAGGGADGELVSEVIQNNMIMLMSKVYG